MARTGQTRNWDGPFPRLWTIDEPGGKPVDRKAKQVSSALWRGTVERQKLESQKLVQPFHVCL